MSDIFSAYTKFHSLPICTVFAISAVPVMPGGVRMSGFNEESSMLQTKPSLQCLSCSSGRKPGNFQHQGVKPSQICLRKTCSDSIFQEQTNEDCDTLHSVLLSGTAKTLLFIHQKTVGCISILLLGNVIVKCLESLSWWKAGINEKHPVLSFQITADSEYGSGSVQTPHFQCEKTSEKGL